MQCENGSKGQFTFFPLYERWYKGIHTSTKGLTEETMKALNISTGIYSSATKVANDVPANAAVLLNTHTDKDGHVTEVEFLAIEGVKSTKAVDIVYPVLAVMLADWRTRNAFKSEFSVAYKNGADKVDSGIRAKSMFTKFLSGGVIYKSDSEGKLTKGVVLDEGVLLRNTALKVTDKHAITTARGNDLVSALINQSKAIVAQCSFFKAIAQTAKGICDEVLAYEKALAQAKVEEKAKAAEEKRQKTIKEELANGTAKVVSA